MSLKVCVHNCTSRAIFLLILLFQNSRLPYFAGFMRFFLPFAFSLLSTTLIPEFLNPYFSNPFPQFGAACQGGELRLTSPSFPHPMFLASLKRKKAQEKFLKTFSLITGCWINGNVCPYFSSIKQFKALC